LFKVYSLGLAPVAKAMEEINVKVYLMDKILNYKTKNKKSTHQRILGIL